MTILPRARVIIDNDFAGDPDGLFQLVHHLLSPSVEIPFIIGSHLSPGDFHDDSDHQADNAARIAREWDELVDARDVPVVAGSNIALRAADEPRDSQGARAIIAEALREDTDLPLFIAMGAGLTELASALLLAPQIFDRLTLIWIGGNEHPSVTAYPKVRAFPEYNFAIDPLAAQVVFNHSKIAIRQVPRDAFRQCSVSLAEIDLHVRPKGEIGARLAAEIDTAIERGREILHMNFGETYVLGDSPLVLLTALTTAVYPGADSSDYAIIDRPGVKLDGTYVPGSGGTIDVFRRLDTRLMHEDLFAKLALHAS